VLGRLRRSAEFRGVYAEGVKAAGRYLVIFARPRKDGAQRLGITVTRRVGSAVVRNRARRRVRELARHLGLETGAQGADVVVNVRRGCAAAPWGELEEDYLRCVTGVLRRLGQRTS
jgi:ribonuclease P protein component